MLEGTELCFTAGWIFALFRINMFKLATYVIEGAHFVVVKVVTVSDLRIHVNIHVLL
jgi:hypothetical protein